MYYNSNWWNMFTGYGTVELYILYRLMEESKDAGDKNSRSDTHVDKFE